MFHSWIIGGTHTRPIRSVVGGGVGSSIVVVGTSSLVEEKMAERICQREGVSGGRMVVEGRDVLVGCVLGSLREGALFSTLHCALLRCALL